MNSITVLSPIGVNRVEGRPVSDRVATLNGLVVGILNNGKPNSELLQQEVTALLSGRFQLAGTVKKFKPHASIGAKGLDVFAREVQVVINAIGD